MWHPTRLQSAIIWVVTIVVVAAWPPSHGQSLAVKVIRWVADPRGTLPTRPLPLPPGLDDDGDAVTAHDLAEQESERVDVVAVRRARLPPGHGGRQGSGHRLGIEHRPWRQALAQRREAGAVREQVEQRRARLSLRPELRPQVDDRLVELQGAVTDECSDEGRAHALAHAEHVDELVRYWAISKISM